MLKLYNALTKKVEPFEIEGNTVNMYSCGPTVYDFAHIGNMRAYLFMDLIRRTLKYNGYTINGVMNITDVGHLTSDEDEGDDKMEVASRRENKSPWEIAEFYTKFFMTQAEKLNIDMPNHIVKATSVIGEIIGFVKGLVDKDYAYETSKGIYFDLLKFSEYGALSGTNINDKKAGARIEVDPEKRHPADFALWIKAPKEHIMQWNSPWGMGYPGWHIECSAMGRKFFGEHIHIHTGGIDHATVHHENEIAQNNCLAGHQVVDRWMHVEFLQVNGGKMSKSLGNFYTIDDLEKRGYEPLVYRYFILNAHYSKKQNFTFDVMDASKTSLERLRELVLAHKAGTARVEHSTLAKYKQDFENAINEDLNIPLALGVMWDMLKDCPKSIDVYNMALHFDQIFGLRLNDLQEAQENIPEDIVEFAERRWQAKQNRDWTQADALRVQISNLGYEILDSKTEYKIIAKK